VCQLALHSWNVLPPLLFLYRRPFSSSCLRRTWWDGVKLDVWRVREKGKISYPGSPGRMACVIVESMDPLSSLCGLDEQALRLIEWNGIIECCDIAFDQCA